MSLTHWSSKLPAEIVTELPGEDIFVYLYDFGHENGLT